MYIVNTTIVDIAFGVWIVFLIGVLVGLKLQRWIDRVGQPYIDSL